MFEQCLYFNTTSLARLVEKAWADAFREFGLTPSQAFCLRVVNARPGIRPSELADILGVSRATATRLLDHLQAKGWVTRLAYGADNRELSVMPTGKAKSSASQIERSGAEMSKKMKAALSGSELSAIVEKLRIAKIGLS